MSRFLFTFVLSLMSFCVVAQPYTISGYVRDGETGETLISAEIYSGATGTTSNAEGRYAISLKGGTVEMHYHFSGYRAKTVSLTLVRDTTVNVTLIPDEHLEGAIITAYGRADIHSPQMGVISIPIKAIRGTPVFFGEQDLLKTIQLLPGIHQGQEGFSSFFVRGGSGDENLFLLDGVPLYNVSHMLGLFSAFTPEAVKSARIFKGAFPAHYGGRASGVVDIRTNDGNNYKLHGSVGVGLLSGKLHLEGPIITDKTTFSISGRLMHTGLAAPVIRKLEAGVSYDFYDVTAKISHRFSDRDQLYFSLFAGQDDFYYRKADYESMKWGNSMAAFRWHHVLNGKWTMGMQCSFNRFGSDSEYESVSNKVVYGSLFSSLIRDYTVSSELDGYVSSSHHIKIGASAIYHFFSPSSRFITKDTGGDGVVLAELNRNPIYAGSETAVYLEDEISVMQGWTLFPGIRYVLMQSQETLYHSFQPRFSMSVKLPLDFYMKAGYARMGQYVHQLSSSSIAMPSDIWVPVTSRIKPVISDICSVGLYYKGQPEWEFSVEVYSKHSDNVLDYRDGASLYGSMAGWESLVEMGESRSKGIEFYANKYDGRLSGWVSYTLSKTERRFPNGYINHGDWFPFKYDHRHVFHIFADLQISNDFDVSASWSFMSGAWITLPERTTAYVNMAESEYDNQLEKEFAYVAYYYPSRNNYHLPPSHTLNLSANFQHQSRRGRHLWSIGVYNLYNAMNPNLVFMKMGMEGYNKNEEIVVNKYTYLPILPSVSYSFVF